MKKIAFMALMIGGLEGLHAQSLFTSTGDGNWNVSFSQTGSGTPRTYIIRAQDSIFVNVSSTHTIDTVDVYGILSFGSGRKLDLTTGGIVMVQTGGSIEDGNGGSKFDFASGTDITGPFSVAGPAYAKSSTGGVFILGPIPVTWLDFSVKAAGRNIGIEWKTAAEYNSLDFEVQTGWDGLHWTALHRMPAAGQSSTIRTYSYLHKDAGAGAHFYRIRQNDQNGSFTYSDIRYILLGETLTPVCKPNPVSDLLTVEAPTGAKIKDIAVYDLNGAQMPASYAFTDSYRIDMRSLDAGMYVVKVLLEDGTLQAIKVIRNPGI